MEGFVSQLKFYSKRVAGVITSPGETMKSLTDKPGLMFPMLLIVLAPLLILVTNYSSIEQALRNYVELANSQAQTKMSPAEAEKFITSAMRAIPVLMPFFIELVWVAGTAAIFGLMKLFRAEGNFVQYLSITGYSLVITAVYILLMILLSFATGSFELKLSLGALVSNTEGNYYKGFLSGILGSFDLFSLWYIGVVGIGFAQVSEMSRKKVYTILFALYAVITLLSALVAGTNAVAH